MIRVDDEKELKGYEKLVEKSRKDKDFGKLPEVPIAKSIASMNLNEVTRGNAGSTAFAEQLSKHSPKWAKWLFGIAAISIILSLILAVVFLFMQ